MIIEAHTLSMDEEAKGDLKDQGPLPNITKGSDNKKMLHKLKYYILIQTGLIKSLSHLYFCTKNSDEGHNKYPTQAMTQGYVIVYATAHNVTSHVKTRLMLACVICQKSSFKLSKSKNIFYVT